MTHLVDFSADPPLSRPAPDLYRPQSSEDSVWMAMASARHWQKLRLPAGKLVLTAYTPRQRETSKELTIYIEGDGLAWLTRALPSDDPTPNNPLGSNWHCVIRTTWPLTLPDLARMSIGPTGNIAGRSSGLDAAFRQRLLKPAHRL